METKKLNWFARFIERCRWKRVTNNCWECAHGLIALGDGNGEAQSHIDAAKDSLYRAARMAQIEGEKFKN